MKQLKIGTTILTIEEVYPFRYDYGKGKQVLRISVLDANHDFDSLKALLKDCTSDIEYLEDGVSKTIYTDYSLDFNSQYNNGTHSIEITRKSEEAIRIGLLETALNDLLLGGK